MARLHSALWQVKSENVVQRCSGKYFLLWIHLFLEHLSQLLQGVAIFFSDKFSSNLPTGTYLDKVQTHLPWRFSRMTDILSLFPLEITYHIISDLSDVEKIAITRVCKPWRSFAQMWVAEHTRQIYAKYQNLLPEPTPSWDTFRATGKRCPQL